MYDVASGIIIAAFLLALLYGGCKLFARGYSVADGWIALVMIGASLAGMIWVVFIRSSLW